MCVLSHSVVSDSLWPHGLQPTRLLHPWDSPGKNTGVSYHFLLWGSSWPKDLTQISCIIAAAFFTIWATRKAHQNRARQNWNVILTTAVVICLISRKPYCAKWNFYKALSGLPLVVQCLKNPPCHAGDSGSIAAQGIKIPHATEQLNPRAATSEPQCHN